MSTFAGVTARESARTRWKVEGFVPQSQNEQGDGGIPGAGKLLGAGSASGVCRDAGQPTTGAPSRLMDTAALLLEYLTWGGCPLLEVASCLGTSLHSLGARLATCSCL